MRVREVFFHDFRSFRGQKRISFVDPLTDAARPLTVLAGTNGSGKTTILETVEGLLRMAADNPTVHGVVPYALSLGLVGMTLEAPWNDFPSWPVFSEISSEGPLTERTLVTTIIAGQRRFASPLPETEWPNLVSWLADDCDAHDLTKHHPPFVQDLREVIERMEDGVAQLHGGLIYFPSDRQLGPSVRGPVEPPPEKPDWLFRFSTPDGWPGSLEQLWVWQNYLDLEEGKGERSHLKSFVETVEGILGPDRRITIREGRVRVPVGWTNGNGERPQVSLDQLPSGERHVLLLFGELARRRRPGAIILIDEPELSLHPTLQRLVVHRLREFAREWDSQVILATHSMEILRAAHESERVILDQLDAPPSPQEEEDACVPSA